MSKLRRILIAAALLMIAGSIRSPVAALTRRKRLAKATVDEVLVRVTV